MRSALDRTMEMVSEVLVK